jgi:hypothetical protein
MRNTIKMTTLIAALAAVFALSASNVRAEQSMDNRSTIQVDDGKGGWKPHEHQKPPAGPTGVSVDKGNGWEPYNPPAKPGPGISVIDDNGAWVPYKPKNPPKKPPKLINPPKPYHDARTGWTFYLMQAANGAQYIQVEDANGADLHFGGSMAWPNTGGQGPVYPLN